MFGYAIHSPTFWIGRKEYRPGREEEDILRAFRLTKVEGVPFSEMSTKRDYILEQISNGERMYFTGNLGPWRWSIQETRLSMGKVYEAVNVASYFTYNLESFLVIRDADLDVNEAYEWAALWNQLHGPWKGGGSK